MKKFLSIVFLLSSLACKVNATWNEWVMPAMMPLMCKAAATMCRGTDRRDAADTEMSSLCNKACEGSTYALAQRCLMSGVNNQLKLGKPVDLSMTGMMVDSALNTGVLVAEDCVELPMGMKHVMDNPIYRSLMVCACSQMLKGLWCGMAECVSCDNLTSKK